MAEQKTTATPNAYAPDTIGPVVAAPIDRESPLYRRLMKRDTHDFRDVGDPLEKVYPLADWRSWERRDDYDRGMR